MYDLKNDPNCIINIVKNDNYIYLKDSLRKVLINDLTKNKDPRVLGNGEVFDKYIYAEKRTRDFYNRHMNGELLDSDWVNSTDFESDVK